MDQNKEHSRLFGKLSPAKLFFRCAVPSMISMAVTSLYTIADGIFVGHFIGAEALAAVNLVMPVIMISFALADMVAVGSSVQISIRLGEKQTEEACRIFSFSCWIILVIAVFVGLTGYFGAGFLVAALKAEALVAEMAGEYLKVYAVFSPLVMCFFAVDNYLRICGRMRYSMWMNVGVSLANIGLDALFVAGFGWGIWSAALASCQCLAAGTGISFYPFLRKKLVLRFTRGSLRLRTVGNILANGSSEFFSNITSSVCMVLFNVVLMNLRGYLAVAAFSVVMYVDSIVKSLLFGMSDALQPAISYNYGAGEKKRVFALEIRVQAAALVISAGAMAGMLLGADGLSMLFAEKNDKELIAMSARAMRLFSLSYLFSWCGIVSSSFFTALNRPAFSLVMATSETLILPLIGLMVLPGIWGLDGVWLTSLATGVIAAGLAGILMGRTVRKVKSESAGPDPT